LKIIGLFCKIALQIRRYSAKETCNFKEPDIVAIPYLSPSPPSLCLSGSLGDRDSVTQVSQKCQKSVTEVSQKCHGSVAKVSRKCHGSITEVSQKCHKSVTEVSQKCHKSVTEVSRRCHRSVTKVSQKCRGSVTEVSQYRPITQGIGVVCGVGIVCGRSVGSLKLSVSFAKEPYK